MDRSPSDLLPTVFFCYCLKMLKLGFSALNLVYVQCSHVYFALFVMMSSGYLEELLSSQAQLIKLSKRAFIEQFCDLTTSLYSLFVFSHSFV